jgi:AbrB family looped-hinge helix DNA binding protein
MKTTIDKAGRVVIPAAVREKAGFRPGIELEVVLDGFSVRLVRAVAGPELVRAGKRWVARPTVRSETLPAVDVAKLIQEERERWP